MRTKDSVSHRQRIGRGLKKDSHRKKNHRKKVLCNNNKNHKYKYH